MESLDVNVDTVVRTTKQYSLAIVSSGFGSIGNAFYSYRATNAACSSTPYHAHAHRSRGCGYHLRLFAPCTVVSIVLNLYFVLKERASNSTEYFKHNFKIEFFCYQNIVEICVHCFHFYFQVMVQRHNRHMSFSIYICVLAIADTVTLSIGEFLRQF